MVGTKKGQFAKRVLLGWIGERLWFVVGRKFVERALWEVEKRRKVAGRDGEMREERGELRANKATGISNMFTFSISIFEPFCTLIIINNN